MDSMQKAVQRARQKGDGSIGKTESSASAESLPDDDVAVLAELGLSPEQLESRTASRLRDRIRFSTTRTLELDRDWLERNRIIAHAVADQRVEVYRQLRSQVLNRMRKHKLTNFAITSAHEDAGKTLTAINLAISMSMELNQTVMLVDLDLRAPGVHEALGLNIDCGLIDHLCDGVPLEDVLINPGFERLVVLGGRPVEGNLSELLTSPEMSNLFYDITTRYHDRLVIFDLPPLLRNDDAMAFLPNVDACLFVVEDDVTTVAQVQSCMRLLADTRLLGTVLNKAP